MKKQQEQVRTITGHDITLREMAENDIPRVSEVLCTCYRWLAEREGFSHEELKSLIKMRGSVETVRKESTYELYLVACKDQTIAGMVSVKENEITKLYVDPAHFRQGVGGTLFRAAERNIIENKYSEIRLVAIGETPIPFYEAMGMSVVGYKRGHSGRKVAIMKKLFKG
ncbi:MAG: GNAT family N-acetyltransferase [bacterium]